MSCMHLVFARARASTPKVRFISWYVTQEVLSDRWKESVLGELLKREPVHVDVVRTEPIRKAAVADGDRAEGALDVLDEYFAAYKR